MKIAFVFISALLYTCSAVALPTRMNLSQALQNHVVTVTAEATGNSYMQQGLKLTVKNTGSLNFILVVNQGVTFKATDDKVQPLILAGEETVPLQPLKEASLVVQTFCANSNAMAPAKGQAYRYSGMADDNVVKLLVFLKQNRMFNELGQQAVWMFTNGHNLNSVYDGSNEFASKKLQDFLITLTGQSRPEYYVKTGVNAIAGQAVHNPKTLKIYATFEERLEAAKKLTLGVYNEQGAMVQPVFENRNFGPAGHRFKVEFEAKNVPAGKYYIRLKEGDAVLRETMVEVK